MLGIVFCLILLTNLSLAHNRGDYSDKACTPTFTLKLADPTSYDHKKYSQHGDSKWGDSKDQGKYPSTFYCGEVVSFLVGIDSKCNGQTKASFKLTLNSESQITTGFTGLVSNPMINPNDPSIRSDGDSVVTAKVTRKTPDTYSQLEISVDVSNVEKGELIVILVNASVCCDQLSVTSGVPSIPVKASLDSCASGTSGCACSKYTKTSVNIIPVVKDNFCCDGDPCTRDTFIYGTNCGCSSVPKLCSDPFDCTRDRCNVTDGTCISVKDNSICQAICASSTCIADGSTTSGCSPCECTTSSDCKPAPSCVDVTCNYGQCSYTPNNNNCNSPPHCYTALGVCDRTLGCQYTTPVSCTPDAFECTSEYCNPVTGLCEVIPNNDLCTLPDKCHKNPTCDINQGCISEPISCDDGIRCTQDNCDATNGCQNIPDNSNCGITDNCNAYLCEPTNRVDATGCITKNLCDDSIDCTDDSCVNGVCNYVPNDNHCNDNIDCTNDFCNNTPGSKLGCQFIPFNELCSADECNFGQCDPTIGGCKLIPKDCSDNNPCTLDLCSADKGGCNNPANTDLCNDGLKCTTDVCRMTSPTTFTCTNNPLVGSSLESTCGISPNPECSSIICNKTADCVVNSDASLCTPQSCQLATCDLKDGCKYSSNCPLTSEERIRNCVSVCAQNDAVCPAGTYCCVKTCPAKRSLAIEDQPNGDSMLLFSTLISLTFLMISTICL